MDDDVEVPIIEPVSEEEREQISGSMGAVGSRLILGAGIAAAIGTFSILMISPYLGLHAQNLQAPASIIGVILGVRNLSQIFFRVPLGKMSDNYGRLKLIQFGFLMYATAELLLFIGPSWHFVLIAAVFIGLGMSAIWPTLFALASDATTQDIGAATGKILRWNDVGSIVAPLVAGLVLSFNGTTYRHVFILAMVLTITGLFLIRLVLFEPIPNPKSLTVLDFSKDFVRNFFKSFNDAFTASTNRSLLYTYLSVYFIASAGNGAFSFSPFLMKESGLSDSSIGFVFSFFAIPVLVGKVWLGSRVDRFGFKKTIIGSLFVSSSALFLLSLSSNPLMFFLSLTILFAALSVAYPAFNYSINQADHLPVSKGIAIGTLGIYISLGRGISNLLIGYLWTLLPLRQVFQIVSVLILFGMLLLLILPIPDDIR